MRCAKTHTVFTAVRDPPTVTNFRLNGAAVAVSQDDASRPLLWVLRERFRLLGTKFGCGHGGCGACMVIVDGKAVTACTTPTADVDGSTVTTIEGLAAEPSRPLFRAWLAEQVPQCGYCQPGMLVAAEALLAGNAHPDDHAIDAAIDGVLCRCGSYSRVRRAIHRAAEEHWDDAPFRAAPLEPPAPIPTDAVAFNPWVAIAPDGTVVVTVGRSEMGQGVMTASAMLVAEELDVSLSQVRTRSAPADHVYDNPVIGMQITVGSLSMRTGWIPLRAAGADARERLVAAAAARWNVVPADCRTVDGAVVHAASGRRLDYGVLAPEAVRLPAIVHPALRDLDRARIIGKPTARLELADHVAGRTIFGLDVAVDGMLHAAVAMPPRFGAKPRAIDDRQTRELDGIRDVRRIGDAVAVVGVDTWTALRGRELLAIDWAGGSDLATDEIEQRFHLLSDGGGVASRNVGNASRALRGSALRIIAGYDTPYLAHAPIEPLNCTASVADGRCEVWVPTQAQTLAQNAAAAAAGVAPDAVTVHTTFLGGGFGRRAVPDIVAQTVELARIVGRPVQLVWSRHDDFQHDRFRPANYTKMEGGLDARGRPVAWFQRTVGPRLALEGIDVPYAIPNLRLEIVEDDPGVPFGYWRSVGASQNAFAIESFIDELAHAAGADPVAFRLELLTNAPRHRAVLELAAARAGWGSALPPGRARGAAVYYAHGGWAAQIAEVSVDACGAIVVHRIVCAVDCGFTVNPDTVVAQIEGGIAFGLCSALWGRIDIAHGRVAQTTFRDYRLLRCSEMPEVEVAIVPSREDPSGAGECGVPPVAPAVANAVFAATGRRRRALPLCPVAATSSVR